MAGSEKKKADDLLQEGYAKYYTAIYRYALSRLGDPHKSEDVAQEAFVVYYKRLRTGEVFTMPRAFCTARRITWCKSSLTGKSGRKTVSLWTR